VVDHLGSGGARPGSESIDHALPVGRVRDDVVLGVREPVDDQVVEDTAVRVGDHRVLRAARPQPARNPHERAVQELRRPAAGDLDLRHVGQVEEARRGPDRGVLREIRPVAQRHEPATERDHAGSE